MGAGVSPNADRRPSLDTAFGPAVGAAVATFSEAARTHRLSPSTLDALIEALPVGLLVMDRDGEVSFANEAARTLEANVVPLLQRVVARALRTDQVVCEEFAVEPTGIRARIDARSWLAVRAVPVRNAGARAHAAVVTVNDITAQTRANSWEPAIASLMSL
ncbi:MAG: PAS domain-containing protein [Gemmatimonadaceae bacterium]